MTARSSHRRRHATALARAILGAAAVAALAGPARADDDRITRTPLLPKYQQECASCHIAYPPGLLGATSWQRLMGGLNRHFVTDASLDEASVHELTAWLTANAGTYKKVRRETAPPPEDRITRSDWFVREHREVAVSTWKLPAVKSAANCAACHTKADQGEFRERDIRIPR